MRREEVRREVRMKDWKTGSTSVLPSDNDCDARY